MQTAGRTCGLKYKQGKEVFPGLRKSCRTCIYCVKDHGVYLMAAKGEKGQE